VSTLTLANVELSCLGLYADKLCMIKIYVKADTFRSRSVAPGQLRRLVERSRYAAEKKSKIVYNSYTCPISGIYKKGVYHESK